MPSLPTLWEALDLGRTPAPSLPLASREPRPDFEPLGEFETIEWDYRFSAHSTRGHPLTPLRDALTSRRLPDACTVAAMPNGRRLRYAGIVICRQRPATASSVTFMTLEDETGFVNVVVWKRVFDEHSVLARTASFLGVTGKLQCESGVVTSSPKRSGHRRSRPVRRAPAAGIFIDVGSVRHFTSVGIRGSDE